MKMGAIAAAILCAVAAGRDAQAEQKFQRLTGAQIQTKFAGMGLTDEAHCLYDVRERDEEFNERTVAHGSIGAFGGATFYKLTGAQIRAKIAAWK